MEYSLLWGSKHPGHLVYVVDLSFSMGKSGKIERVLHALQEVSDYLVGQCEDFDQLVERFDLTILGYNNTVFTLFKGNVSELDDLLEQRDGKLLFDIENEAKPQGLTYTADALKEAMEDVKEWVKLQSDKRKYIPVPIVIHVTDGHPEEDKIDNEESASKALKVANELKNISLPDGHVLLFNIHISGHPIQSHVRFPDAGFDDKYRNLLYEMSSELPEPYFRRALACGFDVKEHSRFMISNETDSRLLTRLIAFGSSVSMTAGPVLETPMPE